MAVEVRIPTILRTYTGGEKSVEAERRQPERAHRRPRGRTTPASRTAWSRPRTGGPAPLRQRLRQRRGRPLPRRSRGRRSATATRSSCSPPSPAARIAGMGPDARRTFVLVDGENIDATLGGSVLAAAARAGGASPLGAPHCRSPSALWGQPVTGLFFLNATNGNLPHSFVQALLAIGYRPVPLRGRTDREGRRPRHPAHPRRPRRP